MKVRDVATKDVYCISPNSTVSDAAAMMKRHGVGVLPVCNGNKVEGLITDRDIVIEAIAAGVNPADRLIKDFMTANPVTVQADLELEDAARIMGREQVRRLPVLEGNNMVGFLSLGDISMSLISNPGLVAETLRKISMPTMAPVTC